MKVINFGTNRTVIDNKADRIC